MGPHEGPKLAMQWSGRRSWRPDDTLISHDETGTDAERPHRPPPHRGSSCSPPAHSRWCGRLTLLPSVTAGVRRTALLKPGSRPAMLKRPPLPRRWPSFGRPSWPQSAALVATRAMWRLPCLKAWFGCPSTQAVRRADGGRAGAGRQTGAQARATGRARRAVRGGCLDEVGKLLPRYWLGGRESLGVVAVRGRAAEPSRALVGEVVGRIGGAPDALQLVDLAPPWLQEVPAVVAADVGGLCPRHRHGAAPG